jgi:hypothetical protein
MGNDLRLECIAIGSMPHNNLIKAFSKVRECYSKIPFWPQMVKLSKNEDMILQYTEGMPSFFTDKSYLDVEYDEFYDDLEQFFVDYETVVSGEDADNQIIDKYAISAEYSCSFPLLVDYIKENDVKYAKGQIVGPFTLSTTFVDKDGKCAVYDDTLKEIIIKTLTLKVVWQIKKMKTANPDITPIIFIDEPSISQLGTSAYVSISDEDVICMLKEISDVIQSTGALSAVHCCGKCDWSIPIKSGISMINLDAFGFAQNLSIYSDTVEEFLKKNGKIVWGIVPTLDFEALIASDINNIEKHFYSAVNYLTNKGIDEKLIIDNSLVSTSCGTGSLSEELAEKAFKLTSEVSEKLKERYNDL